MAEAWPWLVLTGLGAFHGLNPAMGWLFAVALGMHRTSIVVVIQSLVPIALGHAVSVTAVAFAVVMVGTVVDGRALRFIAGLLLIGWAAYHAVYGHRHRVRFGMRVGLLGLAVWSGLMAAGHGAGFMLVSALMPLCAASPTRLITADTVLPVAVAAVSLHTLAMLIVTGVIAVLVYKWANLAFLRRAWVNVDFVWTAALVANGGLLVAT
jgi:hypothetical protein